MEVKRLSYERSGRSFFTNITFNTVENPLVVIRGKNGSGKSTLLKIILGLLPASSGVVKLSEKVAYVPDSSEQYFSGMTPRILYHFLAKQYGLSQDDMERQVSYLMDAFSFGHHLYDQTIQTLSLGEKKKVMLIAAFLADAQLIVMDEPFSALDEASVFYLVKHIKEDLARGKTFILVSHDSEELLEGLSPQIIMLGETHDQS